MLDVGTASDPVLRRVELIVRDVPIDTARDPFQWGNGLLNFGTPWCQGVMRIDAPDRLELAYAVRMSAWLLFHEPDSESVACRLSLHEAGLANELEPIDF